MEILFDIVNKISLTSATFFFGIRISFYLLLSYPTSCVCQACLKRNSPLIYDCDLYSFLNKFLKTEIKQHFLTYFSYIQFLIENSIFPIYERILILDFSLQLWMFLMCPKVKTSKILCFKCMFVDSKQVQQQENTKQVIQVDQSVMKDIIFSLLRVIVSIFINFISYLLSDSRQN